MTPGRALTVAFLLCALVGAVPARAATVEIAIENLAFSKADAAARVGDTVVWVNHDIFRHTATAKNGDFKVTIEPGKSAQVVLKKAGTVDYYCEFHPTMKARLVVTAPVKKKTPRK